MLSKPVFPLKMDVLPICHLLPTVVLEPIVPDVALIEPLKLPSVADKIPSAVTLNFPLRVSMIF